MERKSENHFIYYSCDERCTIDLGICGDSDGFYGNIAYVTSNIHNFAFGMSELII